MIDIFQVRQPHRISLLMNCIVASIGRFQKIHSILELHQSSVPRGSVSHDSGAKHIFFETVLGAVTLETCLGCEISKFLPNEAITDSVFSSWSTAKRTTGVKTLVSIGKRTVYQVPDQLYRHYHKAFINSQVPNFSEDSRYVSQILAGCGILGLIQSVSI